MWWALWAACDREGSEPLDTSLPEGPPVVTPLHRWLGDEEIDQTGRRLVADDWDGDGRDEIVISAPSDFVYGPDAGRSHGGVYRVSNDTPDGVLEDVALGSLVSDHNGDYFGYFLAAPGDLTGDGVPDLAIHGRIEDGPWIYLSVYAGALEGERDIRDLYTLIEHENTVEQAGDFSPCGDLDGDGSAELCIGNNTPPLSASPGDPYVKAYLFHGPLPPGTLHLSDAEIQLIGLYEDIGGYMLGGGSDLTGDGLSDLVAGADERGERRGGGAISSRILLMGSRTSSTTPCGPEKIPVIRQVSLQPSEAISTEMAPRISMSARTWRMGEPGAATS